LASDWSFEVRVILVVCALLIGSCFPQLPDPLVVDDLRVLAVQVSPASVLLSSQPLPKVTVRALTVDPEDPEGRTINHSWGLALGAADFDGIERLEALLPKDATGPEIELDFSALFARDEVVWTLGRLPLEYFADNGQLVRESIKIVNFLTPELQVSGDDDDSASGGCSVGDDDDSAVDGPPFGGGGFPGGDDDDSAPFGGFSGSDSGASLPTELPEDWNANPTFTRIERVGAQSWSVEEGTLSGPTEALYVGEVSSDTGLHLRIEVSDDQPTSLLSVEMFRTTGRAGLPDPDADPEDENQDSTANFGSGDSPVLDDELIPREFGWTPFRDANERNPRLFLVLRDREGGQTWQEIIPQAAPAQTER